MLVLRYFLSRWGHHRFELSRHGQLVTLTADASPRAEQVLRSHGATQQLIDRAKENGRAAQEGRTS